MTLPAGLRLGPYEILAFLGAGGMGEVYRARDTKLARDVAIKIVPEVFVGDAERVARFEREAQLLAALNHPSIAAVYGIEERDRVRFFVMELVDGESLADRLRAGKLPWPEALALARQLAEALQAAHEKGIVHRDLKPANIMLTVEGHVKVLDFGLAKMLEPDRPAPSTSTSPTMSLHATSAGVVLGTAAYMSPEQARGKAADKRSDVWAFGCVLFEMLAGSRAFDGEDLTDTIAAVVRGEPKWHALPAEVPADIVALLRRCLEKDLRRRFADISIPLFLLEERERTRAHGSEPPVGRLNRRRALPLALALVLASAATAITTWILVAPSVPPSNVTRFAIPLGEGRQFTNTGRRVLALDPDGRHLVYVANGRLWLRDLAQDEARPIAGTEGFTAVTSPTFSPDGQSIAFWAANGDDIALRRILVAGGTAVTLCRADNPFGMTWYGDAILFAERGHGVLRVAAAGGEPELLVTAKPDELLASPQMLPGNDAVLLTSVAAKEEARTDWDTAAIVVQSLKSRDRTVVVKGGSDGRLLPTGHLVFAVQGVLFAKRFDARRFTVPADAVPMIEGVRRGLSGVAQFSASRDGTLVYVPGPVSTRSEVREVALIDREGHVTPLKMPADAYEHPRVSPDGRQLAVGTDDGKEGAIWIYELSGATARRRLTLDARNRGPVWTADGQRVTFQSDRDGDLGMFWQRADGAGAAERLTKAQPGTSQMPQSWSPDGKTLLYVLTTAETDSLWTYSLPEKRMAPFDGVQGSRRPISAAFSPDGRWVAYNANVQPFPPTGATYTIGSGIHPFWSPDQRELYLTQLGKGVVAVSVSTQHAFGFGEPVELARRGFIESGVIDGGPGAERNGDITPDGRFVGTVPVAAADAATNAQPQIQIIENWFEELKQRVK